MPLYRGPGLPTEDKVYPVIKEDLNLIRDSILTILTTKIGQRLFNPSFGSILHELIFSQNDRVTARVAEEMIAAAITKWEPRVLVKGVKVFANEHVLHINLSLYMIRVNITIDLPLTIVKEYAG